MEPVLIALIGAECTGKTTLAQALAQRMGGLWLPEYLRTFCGQHGRTPRREEQAAIMDEQLRQESALLDQARILQHPRVFCDTTPLLTAIYSECMFGDTALYARARVLHQRYALTLLLEPDIPWQADGLQRDGVEMQTRVHAVIARELAALSVPYVHIRGEREQRLLTAIDATLLATG